MQVTFTIPINSTASNAVRVDTNELNRILIPSAMDGTTLKVQHCETSDGTFTDLYYNNSQVLISSTVSTTQKFTPGTMYRLRYIRLVSNATETAARTIIGQTESV